MSFNDKLYTTLTWAKQITTVSYPGFVEKMMANKFILRNKKAMLIYLVFFLFLSAACHLSFRGLKSKYENDVMTEGLEAATVMGEKIGPSILEEDILSLNVALGEMRKKNNPVFSTILNHENKILVHNDPDKIGKSYDDSIHIQLLKTGNEAEVYRMVLNGDALIGFVKDVSFYNKRIGKIIIGISAHEMDQQKRRYDMLIVASWIISIAGFFLALVITDKYLRGKKEREQKLFETTNVVGPYRLTKKIGQGGMAELYLANYIKEDGFRRTVAVKKLLPHLAENQDFVDMFIREARLAAKLQHPNIVQIIDLIKIHNSNLIAMEYIDGKNLAEIMVGEKQGLPVRMATFLIQKISLGLYYSHTVKSEKTNEPLKIVHRDITPQNMLISFKGEVKISDFGISKARSEPSFTQAGVIKGKLSYLSPEQALGKETDHQSDLYALGIVFHEILSGKRVYRFENELDALSNLPTMKITPIVELRPDIPDELNAIVMKCLEKEKSKRYQSGKEIYDALTAFRKRMNISYDESNLVEYMMKRFK